MEIYHTPKEQRQANDTPNTETGMLNRQRKMTVVVMVDERWMGCKNKAKNRKKGGEGRKEGRKLIDRSPNHKPKGHVIF
jgi:hypothetical protein